MREAFQFEVLQTQHEEIKQKLLSLQSELQFKDAEMNELRTRLQNCERNKLVTQTVLTPRKSTQPPSSRTTQEETAPLVSLQEAQKLAITGLNLIAMDEGLSEGSPTESRREFLHFTRCKIRGAVHLLPLVEHHIGAYCQAAPLADKSANGSCGNHSAVPSSTNTVSSKEDFRLSLEETTLISLGILYYLAFYSWDVVHTLLSAEVEKSSAAGDEQVSTMDKNGSCDNQCDNKEDTRAHGGLPVAPEDTPNNSQAQCSLFKKLLQVLAFSAARGSQTDSILNQSLKVLVKLAENSTMDLLMNFQHLLSSRILLCCLCPETPLPAALLTVRLLSVLAQHHKLVAQLCSRSDTCLLLALYVYITSRPDKSASETLWLQLEQETVRLLTRCMRCPTPAVLLPGSDCQCHLEVVKTLIIMLHRQWMKIRRSETSLCASKERIIQFLRDAVLLLHSLSQKDKLFHEHCLEVLHQYDQAMPGIRAILKKTQKLSACEELILDELYPSEPEAEDQGMDSS
ncbi:atr-interacting protein [Limosa lapponica baueri]|uniref:Atr-interacting protein n=1 Tax=Limosa lapponica baueri TaxID=1758121 RepID=A0A2I0TCE1_LIMLA|nr:atr-interacting protein [Limosa lapponica baueri]